jgi:TatD DNase family protein
MWIDTHAHLGEVEFDNDRPQVMANARAAQLEKICLIGSDRLGAERALRLAQTDDLFDCAIGFHPIEAHTHSEADIAWMFERIQTAQLVAIGEIGLDYHWQKDPAIQATQRELFVRQLHWAETLKLPVIVHSRDAMDDTYTILAQHAPTRKGIMHCFSGSAEMAQRFVDLGFFISLAGPLTFPNARMPKDVAQRIDVEHLMIETDSPYLAPQTVRGQRNEPAHVVQVAKALAELKGLSEASLQAHLRSNYLRFVARASV